MESLTLSNVEAGRRAGVALDAISTARQHWQRQHRRPAALTAREALAALQFEALLVWTAAHNIANGIELEAEDLARLTIACKRIDAIAGEVNA
jgi:hypothetical protein